MIDQLIILISIVNYNLLGTFFILDNHFSLKTKSLIQIILQSFLVTCQNLGITAAVFKTFPLWCVQGCLDRADCRKVTRLKCDETNTFILSSFSILR